MEPARLTMLARTRGFGVGRREANVVAQAIFDELMHTSRRIESGALPECGYCVGHHWCPHTAAVRRRTARGPGLIARCRPLCCGKARRLEIWLNGHWLSRKCAYDGLFLAQRHALQCTGKRGQRFYGEGHDIEQLSWRCTDMYRALGAVVPVKDESVS